VAGASLAVPGVCARHGRYNVLVGGVLVEALGVVAFGFVPALLQHAHTAQLWALLLLRFVQGIGEAAQSTALLAYATDAFAPRRLLGTAMGLQETAAGVGFVLGPPIGALLADASGFAAPFCLIGAAIAMLLGLFPSALAPLREAAAVAAEAAGKAPHRAGSPVPPAEPPWSALATRPIIIAGAATAFVGTAFGTIVPTLAPHLSHVLALTTTTRVGLAYVIPAAIYGAACPLAGAAADRHGYCRVMRLGFLILGLAFVMMGPLPPLAALFRLNTEAAAGSARAWVWAMTAMVLFGSGAAAAFVPTMPAMERGASRAVGPAGTEAVAGLYWTLYFFGEGVGPFFGSALVNGFGAGWGYGVIGAALAGFALYNLRPKQSGLDEPEAPAGEYALVADTEMQEIEPDALAEATTRTHAV
jgi:MFS family permease